VGIKLVFLLGYFCEVLDYHISEINDQEIIVDVFGDLYVILEYGSRQERHEGDGLDIKQNFSSVTKSVRIFLLKDIKSTILMSILLNGMEMKTILTMK
jgi:hypothetical protein